MGRPILFSAACVIAFSTGCETYPKATQNGAVVSGPESCELSVIEKWMRDIARRDFSRHDDGYSTYDVYVTQVDGGWKVYLQKEVNGIPQEGGSPIAILDKYTCDVVDFYITQ